MAKGEKIEHTGVVKAVGRDSVEVNIQNRSACSGCHAKNTCGMSESVVKTISAPHPDFAVKVGDIVNVEASLKQGYYAVVIAYCLPVILIFAVLILGDYANWSETTSALASILVLIPYFAGLYLLKEKIGKRISFKITTRK